MQVICLRIKNRRAVAKQTKVLECVRKEHASHLKPQCVVPHVCFATARRFFIRKQITCNTPHVIYLCTCKNCGAQGVGTTNEWKRRLANYKSHTKHRINSCSINKHFNTVCRSPDNTSAYLSFQLIDCLDNISELSLEEIDNLLLQKEKHWIATLVTMHKGTNSTHDWNRRKRRDVDESL